ncbi:MAG TPA: hypothetical protein VGP36_00365 [Mycobacteriales bacterium]|jgi:hypothetical protein|nr:hypothetical protein [Mycobacteriales bacterium]
MLRRTGLVVVAALLASLGGTAAYADPSVIGDGGIVGDGDYIGSANPDASVTATAGAAQDDACAPVDGTVSAVDAANAQSRAGQAPTGPGRWKYVVCAATADDAFVVARLYPQVGEAKAHCAVAADACVVVAVWSAQDKKPRQPQNPPSRLGAFDHWLDFTPDLTTSPTHQDALVAQLPTWVWDRNTADVRGICLPIFGGVCGFAVRLGTTWETEGNTFCRSPGTEYRPGRDDPRSASSCSWTYQVSGTYDVEGCKNWLIVVWRLPWVVPIVFPLELCHTDQVDVQEAQVLSSGGGAPR